MALKYYNETKKEWEPLVTIINKTPYETAKEWGLNDTCSEDEFKEAFIKIPNLNNKDVELTYEEFTHKIKTESLISGSTYKITDYKPAVNYELEKTVNIVPHDSCIIEVLATSNSSFDPNAKMKIEDLVDDRIERQTIDCIYNLSGNGTALYAPELKITLNVTNDEDTSTYIYTNMVSEDSSVRLEFTKISGNNIDYLYSQAIEENSVDTLSWKFWENLTLELYYKGDCGTLDGKLGSEVSITHTVDFWGKGYISYMKDEFNNSAPFDFACIAMPGNDKVFNGRNNTILYNTETEIPVNYISGSNNTIKGADNEINGNFNSIVTSNAQLSDSDYNNIVSRSAQINLDDCSHNDIVSCSGDIILSRCDYNIIRNCENCELYTSDRNILQYVSELKNNSIICDCTIDAKNITISSDNSTSAKHHLKNIHIKSSVSGELDLTGWENKDYDITVSRNSKGEIKIYCEADLIA